MEYIIDDDPIPTTVSIIGSAGRGEDQTKVNRHVYTGMISKAEEIIEKRWKLDWSCVTLVSGGAAFADHVAVTLSKKHGCKLILHLPAPFKDGKYLEIARRSDPYNSGKVSNFWHRKFSKSCGIDSLKEFQSVIDTGAEITVSESGFHDRNNMVAKSDRMIAFTFKEGDTPKAGGTMDTWKKSSSGYKIHVSLCSLEN